MPGLFVRGKTRKSSVVDKKPIVQQCLE